MCFTYRRVWVEGKYFPIKEGAVKVLQIKWVLLKIFTVTSMSPRAPTPIFSDHSINSGTNQVAIIRLQVQMDSSSTITGHIRIFCIKYSSSGNTNHHFMISAATKPVTPNMTRTAKTTGGKSRDNVGVFTHSCSMCGEETTITDNTLTYLTYNTTTTVMSK